MKFDSHLITGVLLGIAGGLHFSAQLTPYAGIILIVGVVLFLKPYVK